MSEKEERGDVFFRGVLLYKPGALVSLLQQAGGLGTFLAPQISYTVQEFSLSREKTLQRAIYPSGYE